MTIKGTILLGSAALALAACAGQPMPSDPDAPGFWGGLWHGLIAPISFLWSLFDSQVRFYAFPNIGRWYDFGFLIGLSFWAGGGAAAKR